jgi:hypothetical protein
VIILPCYRRTHASLLTLVGGVLFLLAIAESARCAPSQLIRNFEAMIDRILAGDPDREIILMTMNPAWDPPGQFPAGSARPNLAQYYQGYRDVAAERDLLLIDHNLNWLQLRDHHPTLFEQYIRDGVHPTPEALMQIVTPEIIRALTVPEPASSLLACCALLSVMFRRRM